MFAKSGQSFQRCMCALVLFFPAHALGTNAIDSRNIHNQGMASFTCYFCDQGQRIEQEMYWELAGGKAIFTIKSNASHPKHFVQKLHGCRGQLASEREGHRVTHGLENLPPEYCCLPRKLILTQPQPHVLFYEKIWMGGPLNQLQFSCSLVDFYPALKNCSCFQRMPP